MSSRTSRLIDHEWVHDLAKAEISSEAEEIQQIKHDNAGQQATEESTVDFLTDLRAYMQDYVRMINSFSESGKKFSDIKIFNLTQGAADFMLYRNGIKLIIANTAQGVIQFSYDRHLVSGMSSSPEVEMPASEELLAHLGPFGTVFWLYRSERIESEQVARYFFTQFTRLTRDSKKGKSDHKQQILEQIKALLHEQGLDLK